jgi:RNA polymerase sigma-70 factor, ECF subfamily
MGKITDLLQDWRAGKPEAKDCLIHLIYGDLHRIAARHLRKEQSAFTLQATALVHEVYLRLHSVRGIDWKARGQFMAVVASLMRNILVDHARSRKSLKRHSRGGRSPFHLDLHSESELDVVAVDIALNKMTAEFPRTARVVELRFFGGLNAPEIANVTGLALSTVEREWRFAKAWLREEISGRK